MAGPDRDASAAPAREAVTGPPPSGPAAAVATGARPRDDLGPEGDETADVQEGRAGAGRKTGPVVEVEGGPDPRDREAPAPGPGSVEGGHGSDAGRGLDSQSGGTAGPQPRTDPGPEPKPNPEAVIEGRQGPAATAPVDREEGPSSGRAATSPADLGRPGDGGQGQGDQGSQVERAPGGEQEDAKPQEVPPVVRGQAAGTATDRAAHGRSLGDRPAPSPDLAPEQQLLQLHPSANQDESGLRPPHPGTGSAPNRSPLASVGNARSLRAPSRVRRPPWPAQPRTLRPPPGFRKPSASNLRPPPIPRPRPLGRGRPHRSRGPGTTARGSSPTSRGPAATTTGSRRAA